MNKLFFVLVLVVFSFISISFVHAVMSEKNLLPEPLSNLFNMSITSHLVDGNRSLPISFRGCVLSSGVWFNGRWDCNSYVSGYNNLTLISDDSYRDNVLDLDIQYNRFVMTNYTGHDTLFDHGTWAELKGEIVQDETVKLCVPTRDIIYRNVTQTVYINNTVYAAVQFVNVTVPEYVQNVTYIQNVSYVENVTRVIKLESQIKSMNVWHGIIGGLLVFGYLLIFWYASWFT